MSSQDDNIAEKSIDISNWLSQHGVGLELKMVSALRRQFGPDSIFQDIQHSLQYIDAQNNGKLRETDVVFRKSKLIYNQCLFTVTFVIECKYNATKAVVLYKENKGLKLRVSKLSDLWPIVKSDFFNESNISDVHETSIFGFNKNNNCYAITSAPLDGNRIENTDFAYMAIDQLSGGSQGIVNNVVLDARYPLCANVVIPVLITNAPIWTIDLDDNYELRKNLVSHELLSIKTSSSKDAFSSFWIMNEDYFQSFTADIAAFFDNLDYRF